MYKFHPYIRYSQALLIENGVEPEDIDGKLIADAIEFELGHFRMHPIETFEEKDKIKYNYIKEEKGNPKQGIFLSPNIISTDKLARNTWNSANDIIKVIKNGKLESVKELKMSMMPLSGEYLSFSINGNISRGKSKVTLLEVGLSLITTLTKDKPSSQYNNRNSCIIPDISIENLVKFIKLFNKMTLEKNTDALKIGNVNKEGKSYVPKRPYLYKGNYPNAPKSPILSGVGLIAAIGEFAKEEETSELAKSVLDSLKDATLYIIKYGDAQPFSVNHHVIELAKESKLKELIDGLYYSKLYNQDRRSYNNTEYQKFDLMTSRFLQLFNKAAFSDFMSFRAEYPEKTEILFNIYFNKMETIDKKIIESAKTYGNWLNRVAYITAKNELGENAKPEQIREAKAKALIELESAAFSAKDGTSLIAQTVTRAGRLSFSEAPNDAELFFEKTTSGELTLEQSKNLIIAFSRLMHTSSKKQNEEEISEDIKINDSVK